MANEDNLTQAGKKLSTEEAQRIGRKGGIASAEARRKKKLMKEQMELLLGLPVKSKKAIKTMKGLGVNDDNMDNQMALIIALFQQGLKGNVKAFNAIRDTLGELPSGTDADEENILNFLQAMNPTQEDLDNLFAEEVEEAENDG